MIACILVVALMLDPLLGQQSRGKTETGPLIVTRADVPVYPALLVTANISGEVMVRAFIEGGKVTRTEVTSGNRLLATWALANLRTWRFAQKSKHEFTVTYVYEIAGAESTGPTNPKVELALPYRVKVIHQPVKPTVSGRNFD